MEVFFFPLKPTPEEIDKNSPAWREFDTTPLLPQACESARWIGHVDESGSPRLVEEMTIPTGDPS